MTRGGSHRGQLLALALLALIVWLVAYPLMLVLLESVHTAGGWTLEYVRQFAGRPTEWRALWGSCWIAVASVVLSGSIGIPLAVLVTRYDFPGRRILATVMALPAVLPPLVGVVAFLFLYGESGFLARAVQALLRLDEAPWRLEGAAAILLVHAYSMYVYFYLFTRAGLLSLDGSMLEAAASLGAGRWRTLRRVVLPALRPALAGGALLTAWRPSRSRCSRCLPCSPSAAQSGRSGEARARLPRRCRSAAPGSGEASRPPRGAWPPFCCCPM